MGDGFVVTMMDMFRQLSKEGEISLMSFVSLLEYGSQREIFSMIKHARDRCPNSIKI